MPDKNGAEVRSHLSSSRRGFLRTSVALGTAIGIAPFSSSINAANDEDDQIIWKHEFDHQPYSPTVVGDTIYIGGGDEHVLLHTFNRRSGDPQWQFESEEISSSESTPTKINETIYIAGSDPGNSPLVAIDETNGNELWRFETESQIISSSPTVAGGLAYFASSGLIHALNVDSGEEEWAFETGGRSRSSPIIVGDLLYIGGGDEFLHALDAKTGDEVWSFKTNDDIIDLSPTYSAGRVYTGSQDHSIYAIDAVTGDEAWQFETDGPIWTTPTVDESIVFVGSQDGHLYALEEATGEHIWNSGPINVPLLSSPTVADGLAFAFGGRSDSTLYAWDAETGRTEMEFEMNGNPAYSSPLIVDGVLYVGLGGGDRPFDDEATLYAIDTEIDGSSSDSRVVLGTHGHYDSWSGDPHAAKDLLDAPTDDSLGPSVGGLLATFGGLIGGSYLYSRRSSFRGP